MDGLRLENLLKISQNESDEEGNILSSVPNISEKEKVNLKAINV